MKEKIIEICELGHPQSLIQRENAPITEIIKTDLLIQELNEQLMQTNVVWQSEQLCGKTKCNRQKLDNSPLCSYHWDIANS